MTIDTYEVGVQVQCVSCDATMAQFVGDNTAPICKKCDEAPRCEACGEIMHEENQVEWKHPFDDKAALRHRGCVPQVLYLNVYTISLAYGGSEEGGWWYDVGTVVACNAVSANLTREELNLEREKLLLLFAWAKTSGPRGRHSTRGGEDVEVKVEEQMGENYPEEKPYYE